MRKLGSRRMTAFAPGTVLDDKYRIDRMLGTGGMGVVMAATHLKLQERVAIKLLRNELSDRAGASERFLREARAANRIKSDRRCASSTWRSSPMGRRTS